MSLVDGNDEVTTRRLVDSFLGLSAKVDACAGIVLTQ